MQAYEPHVPEAYKVHVTPCVVLSYPSRVGSLIAEIHVSRTSSYARVSRHDVRLLSIGRTLCNLYTQSLPEGAPCPDYALGGTSSFAVHNSTATHSLHPRPITSSSPIICAYLECDNGIS